MVSERAKSPTPEPKSNFATQQQQQQQQQSPLLRSGSVTSIRSMREEEEINLEYLRNVIVKFLESKSTRAQLIPVLTMMLKFTPDEVKRLNHAA